MQTTKKTTQRENCNGLTMTCPIAPDVETRTNMCKCVIILSITVYLLAFVALMVVFNEQTLVFRYMQLC